MKSQHEDNFSIISSYALQNDESLSKPIQQLPTLSYRKIDLMSFSQNQQRSPQQYETQEIVNQEEEFININRKPKLYLSFGKQCDIPINESLMKLNSPYTKEDFITYEAILNIPKNKPILQKDKQLDASPTFLPPRRKGKNQKVFSDEAELGMKKWINPESSLKEFALTHNTQLKVHRIQGEGLYLVQYPLNCDLFQNQLSLTLRMSKNQSIEICSIADPKPLFQQHPISTTITHYPNSIKYILQRFYNQYKLAVMVEKEGKYKNWKDIEIPIISTETSGHKKFIIREKKRGLIEIKFDEFEFSFVLEVPYRHLKYYAIKSSSTVYEVSVQQRVEGKKQEDSCHHPQCSSGRERK